MSNFSDRIQATEVTYIIIPCEGVANANHMASMLSAGVARTVEPLECTVQKVLRFTDRNTSEFLGEIIIERRHYGVPEYEEKSIQ